MIAADRKATIKALIISAIGFSLLFGLFIALNNGIWYALLAGPVTGLLWGLMMYLFISSKKVKDQITLQGIAESDVICSGGANHFKNGEAVGGKLYLLKDHLAFKSHKFNIQNHTFRIEINNIQEVDFYNTIGLISNGMKVILKDGITEKFVVNNRIIWKENIQKLMSSY